MTYTFDPTNLGDAVRFAVRAGAQVLTRRGVLERLAGDEAFADAWVETLRAAPWPAYNLETPPVHAGSADRPFALALLASAPLARTVADPTDFADHFTDAPVAVFRNLGGDAVLVAPAPADTGFGHVAAFTRAASREQQRALWRAVGEAALAELNGAPLWLSTAGLGVPWLHVRLDRVPKYYRTREWRDPAA